MTVSSRSAEILPRFYDPIPPSSVLRLSPTVENLPKIFQVQKVITLEDLQSASRSRPACRSRDLRGCVSSHCGLWRIFKVQEVVTVGNGPLSADGSRLSATKKRPSSADPSQPAGRERPPSASHSRPAGRSTETPIGGSLPTTDFEIFWNLDKVQKVITLEDPPSASRSRPAGRERRPLAGLFSPRTLKYFQSPRGDPTGKSLVRRCFSTERGQRDPRPAFCSTVTSLPPEKGDHSRKCQVRGVFPRVRGKESAIGKSFSTGWWKQTAISGSFGWTLFSKNFQSPRGDYAGRSAIGESFSTGRLRNTTIGGAFGQTLFSKNFQSPKKKKKKSYRHITTIRKLSLRPTFLSHRQDEVRVRPRPGFFFRSCNFYAQNVHPCLLDALWKFRHDSSRRSGSKWKIPPPGTSFCHFSFFLASFGRGKDFLANLWQFPTKRNRDLFDGTRRCWLDSSTPKIKSPCPDWPWFFYPIWKARWQICATIHGFWWIPTCHGVRLGTVRRAFWCWIQFFKYIPKMS